MKAILKYSGIIILIIAIVILIFAVTTTKEGVPNNSLLGVSGGLLFVSLLVYIFTNRYVS